jgi:hypothetical protein
MIPANAPPTALEAANIYVCEASGSGRCLNPGRATNTQISIGSLRGQGLNVIQGATAHQSLGTVVLSGGTAALNTTFPATGSFTLKAMYLGTGNYLASSATVVQVIQ